MMESFPGYDSEKRFAERDRRLRDLAAVLATPEGFRAICDILKALGVCGYVANDPGAIALYNEGENLLRLVMEADAGALLKIMAALRGVEIS